MCKDCPETPAGTFTMRAPNPDDPMGTFAASAVQPMPTVHEGGCIQDLVIADIEARKKIGREKYGTLLQPFNGRDALVDAYQEALDLCQYLRQAIEERDALPAPAVAHTDVLAAGARGE